MNPYFVKNDVLSILDNIESLQEELVSIRAIKSANVENEAAVIEQQIDAYEDTIESLEWDLGEIVEEVVKDILNNELEAGVMESQEKEFCRKKTNALARANRDKELLKFIFASRGERKCQTEHFKVSIQKNGGKRGIEVFADLESLPEQFVTVKQVYTPNKDEIRKALDSGIETNLFAYKPQGEHVVIK